MDGKEGGVSPRTLKYFSMIFCQVFKRAITEQIIDNHPSLNVDLPKKESNSEEVWTILESQEAQQVINLFDDHILKPIIIVALYYGLRRSELVGLKWDSIDFKKGEISINHTVLRVGKKIEQRNKTKNTSSKRSLGLIPEIKELLLGLKAKQDENKKLFKGSYIESDYVFTWKGGKLFRPDYLTKAFQTKLEKSNFKKMRFHDLRHSCATLLNEKGMSEFDIQMWLGHANTQTTKKYTHITKKLQNSIAQNLAGSFAFSL